MVSEIEVETGTVISLEQVREKKLEEKKRKNERLFFTHLIRVTATDFLKHSLEVQMIDVSLDGCAFQIPHSPRLQWPQPEGQPVYLKFYWTPTTYLEVPVAIQNRRDWIDEGVRSLRFGCAVDTGVQAYPAYQALVQFLKLYSLHSHQEVGQTSVFY